MTSERGDLAKKQRRLDMDCHSAFLPEYVLRPECRKTKWFVSFDVGNRSQLEHTSPGRHWFGEFQNGTLRRLPVDGPGRPGNVLVAESHCGEVETGIQLDEHFA